MPRNFFASRSFQSRRTNTRPGAQNAPTSLVLRDMAQQIIQQGQGVTSVVNPLVALATQPIVVDLANQAFNAVQDYVTESIESISEAIMEQMISPARSQQSIGEDGIVEWHDESIMELDTTPQRPQYTVEEPDEQVTDLAEIDMTDMQRAGPKRPFVADDEVDGEYERPEPNGEMIGRGKKRKHASLEDLEKQGGGPKYWQEPRVACTLYAF